MPPMDDCTLPAKDRLILPLDCETAQEALALVEQLEGIVSFYKVGLELFVAAGREVVKTLLDAKLRVFLDLKMDDVDETITRAVRQVVQLGVDFLTIHGGAATARAASKARSDSTLKILSVTLLTSLGEQDLRDLHLVGPDCRFKTLEEYLVWRADLALRNGCDGLITSGQNVRLLRDSFGERNPILVCPGIRPADTFTDEHKRPSTPYNAIMGGADFLVMGRPIRTAPDPRQKARAVIADIDAGLRDRARSKE